MHEVQGVLGRGKVWDHKRHEHDLVLCPGSGQVVDLPGDGVVQLPIPGLEMWEQETLASALEH